NLAKVQELEGNDDFRGDLFEAHLENKRNFVDMVKKWRFKEDVFTIGWARRIAGYKRPALIFHNIEKIVQMAKDIGPVQIVLAGKAHPNDDIGGSHIDKILDHIDNLNEHRNVIRVLILENYDTYFGKLLTSSVDVWLNNPLPPFEASGTSGMKAILNGVLQLTTLDGWVVEAVKDDIGWVFGYQHTGDDLGKETDSHMEEDSQALTEKLEEVLKLYYSTYKDGKINLKSAWIDKMVHCLKCGAFFNTQRMLEQYNNNMWKK
ncbi:MAG: alpha-glucan family phosphorylase, partial [Victivallaceae bacterium]|nr:alpha-glucan family phosphorylase [Victivallaceae bacterium]